MAEHRFVDPSQPQTLQGAVVLSYLNALFGIAFALFGLAPLWLLVLVLEGVAAYGIANERRAGYWLGVASSSAFLALSVASLVTGSGASLLSLLLGAVLVALLLHPQSREYQRIWFR
jgi:uncharacterized membrane protein (DUF2068 family)